jgi:hypothetical protein
MRWVRAVLPVLCFAALLAACGEPATALETVQGAASATTEANTFRFSTVITSDNEMIPTGEAEGLFDVDGRRASMTIDAGQYGLPGVGEIDAIFTFDDGFVIYMDFAALLAGAPSELASKHWVSMDFDALAELSGGGVDLGKILQSSSNDPTSSLDHLRGATNVTEVGSADVRGVDTTHYRATVDLEKAIAESPAASKEALQALLDVYTDTTQEIEVWIDGDDRVRRVKTSVDMSTIQLPAAAMPDGGFDGTMSVTQEFYDFGAEAAIDLPADDEVIDFLDLLSMLPDEEPSGAGQPG